MSRTPTRVLLRRLEPVFALVLFATLLVVCARAGFWTAFTAHREWDDEGYFLLALRAWQEHGGLYDQIRGVFYGPFYFQLVGALLRLAGHEPDHESARYLMIASWLAGSAAIGFATRRLAGSTLAGAVALALGFSYLAGYGNEPLHATSALLVCLVPLLLFAGPLERIDALDLPRRAAVLAACGAICAATVLVKLNVGLPLSLAAATVLAPYFAGRAATAARLVLVLALVLAPWLLMREQFASGPVRNFAALVALASVPFAARLVEPPIGSFGRREALALGLGFGVVLVLSLGACFLDGTSLRGIWGTLVVEALEFPRHHHATPPFPGRPQILWIALAIPASFALRPWPRAGALLRLSCAAQVIADAIAGIPPFRSLPLVAVASSDPRAPARSLIGLAAVLTSLQAYPIPGSQVTIFSLLASGAGAIGFTVALRDLVGARASLAPLRAAVSGALAILVGIEIGQSNPMWSTLGGLRADWAERSMPLELAGCGPLRLPELDVARERWLVANLRANADTLVGVPGLHSLYLWTGLRSPIGFHPHHWLSFGRSEVEPQLARALLETPRCAVVRCDRIAALWNAAGLTAGPLASALEARYEIVAWAGRHQLWLPREVEPKLVSSAVRTYGHEALLARHGAAIAFELTFPPLGGARLARIVVHDAATVADLLDSGAAEPERRLIVVDETGEDLLREPGAAIATPAGSFELVMLWPELQLDHGAQWLFVRAIDETGRVLDRLLFQAAREVP